MSYRFVGNLYNPDGPDATTKLLSENYGDRSSRKKVGMEDQVDDDGLVLAGRISPPLSPECVLAYIKNWLKDRKITLPVPPKGSPFTQEELAEMGYIGVYELDPPLTRRSAPSTGTGTGDSLYPRAARYDKKTGAVIEVLDNDHRV